MFKMTPYMKYSTPRNWYAIGAAAAGVTLVVFLLSVAVLYSRTSDMERALKRQDMELAAMSQRDGELVRRLETEEERNQLLRNALQKAEERLGLTQHELGEARQLAMSVSQRQQQAAARIGQVGRLVTDLKKESGSKLGALSGEVSTAKNDIATTRKDLEETRVQLTSAVGDISNAHSLIARNSDELTTLKRMGERNFYEFELYKGKDPKRVGDVSLKLKKTDTKRQRYAVEVIADDRRTEKKDRTINEPVQFYRAGSRHLYELVVNHVEKNRVVGYLATPKNGVEARPALAMRN